MSEYKVFNEKNVAVKVTDKEIDSVFSEAGVIPTHIANAVALAKRQEFVPLLSKTLHVENRRQQFAAARALLALADVSAIGELEQAALEQSDPVVASMYKVVAIRLAGPNSASDYFNSPENEPKVKSMLLANYDDYMELTEGDISFLTKALRSLLDKSQPWMAALDEDIWATRINNIITALGSKTGVQLLSNSSFTLLRNELCDLILRLKTLRLNSDTQQAAKKLLDVLKFNKETSKL